MNTLIRLLDRNAIGVYFFMFSINLVILTYKMRFNAVYVIASGARQEGVCKELF